MDRVCPSCGRASPVESPFCPACAAPMNEQTQKQKDTRPAQENAPTPLPMKWHKFLIFAGLPLAFALSVMNLTDAVPLLNGFDASLYKPEMIGAVRFCLWLDVIAGALSLPLIAIAEWGLIRMRKFGVYTLKAHYIAQLIYGAAQTVLLLRLGLPAATAIFSVAEMALMLALEIVYYHKRWALFS